MKHLLPLLLVLVALSSVGAQTIFLEKDASRTALRQIREESIDYISGRDLFESLDGILTWSTPDNGITARMDGHTFSYQWGNPYCRLDDTLANLVYAPLYFIDDLYLPVDMLTSVLSNRLGKRFIYNRGRRLLHAILPVHNVAGVYVEEKLNGILLEIALAEAMEYEVFVTEGNWINVTLIGGKLDAARLSREKPSPKVRRVRAFQFEQSAQVSVQMKGAVAEFHRNEASYPDRIQISIIDTGYVQDLAGGDEEPVRDGVNPIDLIVIDPGHGGEHDGAVGRSGLKEKEIVLDIALKLEELLDRDARYTPVLTRRQDHTVALEQRALTANSAAGDLFVSIHANSSTRKEASGCETFFLAAAVDDAARVTELLENSDFDIRSEAQSEASDEDLGFIVMDLLQTEYLQQSKLLADAIQKSLASHLNVRSRGINQAGFAVLNRVSMPSALVEVAFISNKVEERLLAQEEFRNSVAIAIYDGIVKFAEMFDKNGKLNARSD